jgi:hypothetical protein
MNKPRPEAISGDSTAWHHLNSMPSVIETSANPNQRTTVALHGKGQLAETAQTIASIGAIWNSRQPKKIGERYGCEIKYVITAQEIRNRSLAHQLGNALPPNRDGQRTALEHANQTKPTIWQDVAEIAHDHQELKNYCKTLAQHNPQLFGDLKYQLSIIETFSESDSITMSLSKARSKYRQTDNGVGQIASALSALDTLNDNNKKQRKAKGKTKRHKKPELEQGADIWETLTTKIHKLERPHKGRQQPKRIASNIGKNPSRIANYYTDPMRRVFTRKLKSKGALVIVDTSGSMNFNSELLDNIMNASAGATVITYSESGRENCHLVADQGKRVKQLPDTGGNNAVDVPAILWAIKKYHKNPKQQVLLISDGHATGRRGTTQVQCRAELARTIAKHHIHMESDIEQSIIKLRKLGKTKLKTNPESVPR